MTRLHTAIRFGGTEGKQHLGINVKPKKPVVIVTFNAYGLTVLIMLIV